VQSLIEHLGVFVRKADGMTGWTGYKSHPVDPVILAKAVAVRSREKGIDNADG